MRIDQLEIFCQVVKYQSMHLASEHLHMSRQNISKTIQQLESELGCTVFRRSHQGVFLTELGELFLQYASSVIAQTNTFHDTLQNLNCTPTPNLDCLYILTSPHTTPIATAISAEFMTKFPTVKLRLGEDDSERINQKLLTNTIDERCAIVFSCVLKSALSAYMSLEHFNCYLAHEEPLVVYMNINNPLAKKRHIPLGILSELPLAIVVPNDLEKPISITAIEELGITLQIRFTTSSFSICRKYLESDSAFCVGGELALKEYLGNSSQITTVPIKEKIYWDYVIFSRKTIDYPQEKAFLKMVLAYWQDNVK